MGPSFPVHGTVFIPQSRSFATGLVAGDREWGPCWWSRYTQCCSHTEDQCLSSGVSGGSVCTRLAICMHFLRNITIHIFSQRALRCQPLTKFHEQSQSLATRGRTESLCLQASVAQTLPPVAVTGHLSRAPRRKGTVAHRLTHSSSWVERAWQQVATCTYLAAEETKAELAWLPPFS